MQIANFLSKSTGCEIKIGYHVKKGWMEGRIYISFFPLEEGGRNKMITIKLSPNEAFKLAKMIQHSYLNKTEMENVIFHKFEKDNQNIITVINLTMKEKKNKELFGIKVNKIIVENNRIVNDQSIIMPLEPTDYLMFADVLQKWYIECCWRKPVDTNEYDEV